MSAKNIQPITITGCNRGKTGPMLTTDYKLIASFYFTLSAPPAEEWIHVFEHVRQERRLQAADRPPPARVDERGIVIKCRPSELQQHFDNLKTDVATANEQYAQMLARAAQTPTLESLLTEIEQALARLRL